MNDVSPRLPAFRLTELAHGGGCGCKLAPAVLQQLLAGPGGGAVPATPRRHRDIGRRGGLATS